MLARDNHEVDDGWLCDKGRFGFQMIASEDRITEPLIGSSGDLRPAAGTRRSRPPPSGLRAAGERDRGDRRRRTSNEEGYLVQRIVRGALGSPHVDSRADRARRPGRSRRSRAPELGAAIADLDSAESILVVGADPLHAMPILDLRIRKAVRRNGPRLAVASERPTALDGGAEETARYAPGDGAALPRRARRRARRRRRRRGRARGADAERLAGELRPRRDA